MNARAVADRKAGAWQDSAEFRLLRGCALASLALPHPPAPPNPDGKLDWDRLLDMAVDQGMLPLLRRYLPPEAARAMPPAVGDRLADASRRATAQALLLASHLPRILQGLQDAGIPAVPFKGPALAHFLYGDVTLRQMFDLDLLVRREDLPRAQQVLRQKGLVPSFAVPASTQAEMLRNECESSFDSPDGSYAVELHWQIAPRLYGIDLPSEPLMERARTVSFERRPIPLLAPEDQVLALCAHAAKHLFRKFAWIADLAQCLRADPKLDWDLLQERCRRARARRVTAVGLELAALLLQAPVPDNARRAWAGDAAVGRAVAAVLRDAMPDPQSEFRPARHRFHLALCDGWRQRLHYAGGLFLIPTMAERAGGARHGSASRLAHSLSRILQRGGASAAGKASSVARS